MSGSPARRRRHKKTPCPATVPFHPKPIGLQVTHMPTGCGTVTSIARRWKEGDASRCRLCDVCSVEDDICLISVDGMVAREDAPAFSTRGLIKVDSPEFAPPARRNHGLKVVAARDAKPAASLRMEESAEGFIILAEDGSIRCRLKPFDAAPTQ